MVFMDLKKDRDCQRWSEPAGGEAGVMPHACSFHFALMLKTENGACVT